MASAPERRSRRAPVTPRAADSTAGRRSPPAAIRETKDGTESPYRRATSTRLVEHLQWPGNTGASAGQPAGPSLGPADLASIARQDPFVASQVARSLGAAPRAPRSTPPPEAPAVASGAGEDAGWVIEEHPPLGFEAVSGYDALKERIRRQVIVPLQFPNDHHVLDIALATGMILAGPSGVGKTRFAERSPGRSRTRALSRSRHPTSWAATMGRPSRIASLCHGPSAGADRRRAGVS